MTRTPAPGRAALGSLLAVLGLLAWPGCSAQEPAAGGGQAPAAQPAPDFTLPDLAGQPVTLSDFRGKTVVIDFWATWCPPCVFQVPELNKLHSAHAAAQDVVVTGVAVDVEGAEVVAPWAAEHEIQYRVVIGDEDLARRFGVVGFPALVVVTPEGGFEAVHMGLIEYDELEALVEPYGAPRAG